MVDVVLTALLRDDLTSDTQWELLRAEAAIGLFECVVEFFVFTPFTPFTGVQSGGLTRARRCIDRAVRRVQDGHPFNIVEFDRCLREAQVA